MKLPVRRRRGAEGGIETREKEERGIAIKRNFGGIVEFDGNGKMRGVAV